MVRVGGHVLRGGMWVAEAAAPAAEPEPATQPEWDNEPAAGETWADGTPVEFDEPEPEPEPELESAAARAVCLDCGRDVALRKDGMLRKHTCVLDTPAPDVTFGQV